MVAQLEKFGLDFFKFVNYNPSQSSSFLALFPPFCSLLFLLCFFFTCVSKYFKVSFKLKGHFSEDSDSDITSLRH